LSCWGGIVTSKRVVGPMFSSLHDLFSLGRPVFVDWIVKNSKYCLDVRGWQAGKRGYHLSFDRWQVRDTGRFVTASDSESPTSGCTDDDDALWRQDREEELRSIAIQMRQRERERRHKEREQEEEISADTSSRHRADLDRRCPRSRSRSRSGSRSRNYKAKRLVLLLGDVFGHAALLSSGV